MSIFVSTTYFGDRSKVSDALKDLEKIKIKNIELGSNHTQDSSRLILSRGKNYIVHNYFPPKEENFILNIASISPQVRKKSVEFIKKTILWCHKTKVRYYTIHPGFLTEATSQLGYKGQNRNFDLKFKKPIHKNRRTVVTATVLIINDLYKFANRYNVQLLVENEGSKTSKEHVIFDTVEELDLLKSHVGSKLKFNFNLAHATLAGINLKDPKAFRHFYANSLFFEVSEIKGNYDSHLPVNPKKGAIGRLLASYKSMFKKRNIILEFRNIPLDELKKSYDQVNVLGL